MNIRNAFSEFVWPRRCEFCGDAVDRPGRHICSACHMRLPAVGQDACCPRCGRAFAGFTHDALCADCEADPPHFSCAASALRYEGPACDLIKDFKFNRHLWLRDDLVDLLEGAVGKRLHPAEIDLVVPMPTSLYHRLDRGYNQCDVLARALARRLDRPFRADLVFRKGHPKRQSELSEDERRLNARNTFRIKHPEGIRGRVILVVDDVLTTGSTLSECARVLKDAGAAEVRAVTLARSIRER